MKNIETGNQELKHLVHEALLKIMEEDRAYFKQIVAEVLEEEAFGSLMEEADTGEYVEKSEIINTLRKHES